MEFSSEDTLISSEDTLNESPYGLEGTWNSWFHSYASKEPCALQHIIFKPYNAATIPDCECPFLDDETSFLNTVEFTLKCLKKQKAGSNDYRVFPYANVEPKYEYIERKYGKVDVAAEFNAKLAYKGEDMQGWYKLEEVMNRNRERIRRKAV